LLCAAPQPPHHNTPQHTKDDWGSACSQSKQPFTADEKSLTSPIAACGQIGPLQLGMSRADAEKILGSPTTAESFGNKVFYVYSLQMDETAHMITYAVIGYDSERRVGSIQLAGTPWPGAWSFADIKLGDPGKAVISRLGNPHGISPSRQEGALIWDYLPWTFSFEIKGSLVSSIRVSE
jgi:hypothetical protein